MVNNNKTAAGKSAQKDKTLSQKCVSESNLLCCRASSSRTAEPEGGIAAATHGLT